MSKFMFEFKFECIEKYKNHEKIEISEGYVSLPYQLFITNISDWYNEGYGSE